MSVIMTPEKSEGGEALMQTYRLEATVAKGGAVAIKGLPFSAGDRVQVIIRSHKRELKENRRYPLRGKPIHYVAPFKSVAEEDWETLR
jgi:hypothetical protein